MMYAFAARRPMASCAAFTSETAALYAAVAACASFTAIANSFLAASYFARALLETAVSWRRVRFALLSFAAAASAAFFFSASAFFAASI